METNHEKFNRLLNSCKQPRRIYAHLSPLSNQASSRPITCAINARSLSEICSPGLMYPRATRSSFDASKEISPVLAPAGVGDFFVPGVWSSKLSRVYPKKRTSFCIVGSFGSFTFPANSFSNVGSGIPECKAISDVVRPLFDFMSRIASSHILFSPLSLIA